MGLFESAHVMHKTCLQEEEEEEEEEEGVTSSLPNQSCSQKIDPLTLVRAS